MTFHAYRERAQGYRYTMLFFTEVGIPDYACIDLRAYGAGSDRFPMGVHYWLALRSVSAEVIGVMPRALSAATTASFTSWMLRVPSMRTSLPRAS